MGLAIFIMGFVRYAQGAIAQSIADFTFVGLLVFSFIKLNNHEQYFKLIARVVLFFAFALSIFLLLHKHDADSRLVWFSTTLFLLFYLLDNDEGRRWAFIIISGLVFVYLVDSSLIGLKVEEFSIFIFNIFAIVLIINWYEKIKIKSQKTLQTSKEELEKEVQLKTQELRVLNESLEKRVKEEIAKNIQTQQQMVQQSRLAQMGEMISMIAHQWRQPLSAISATSIDLRMKFMLDEYDIVNKPQNYAKCTAYFDGQLSSIEEYIQTLTVTIDDFRNFYKPDKESKIIQIQEPIQKALNIIKASIIANGVEVKETFNSTKEIDVYDSELMQVFLNILKNAQDNFKEKGTKNPQISIRTSDTKENIKIEFCDNGGGIPKSIAEKIFDPYFSTKDEKNGTGLGLYMSKTIIEEHHQGKLYLENRDAGVCFIMELPYSGKEG